MMILLLGLVLIAAGLLFGILFGIIGMTVGVVAAVLGLVLGILLSVLKFITLKMIPLVIGLCIVATLIFGVML